MRSSPCRHHHLPQAQLPSHFSYATPSAGSERGETQGRPQRAQQASKPVVVLGGIGRRRSVISGLGVGLLRVAYYLLWHS